MEPTSDGPRNECLDAAFSRIGEVSTLRDVALRINRVVNDPTTGAVELAGAIGRDPALSARIIRTVNSAAYGLRHKVGRLAEAVTLLGFKRVRNLALAAMICDLFEAGHAFGTYDRRKLWQHMVAVGVGTRAMVSACGHPEPEEAFLAGLLHDIGIILEDQYLHDDFVRVVEAARADESFVETERRVLGFDHTEFGFRVATAWNFPPAVADAVAHHHNAEGHEGPEALIVLAVSVANWVCTENDMSAIGIRNVARPSDQTLEKLGLKPENLLVFADDIQSELAAGDLLMVL